MASFRDFLNWTYGEDDQVNTYPPGYLGPRKGYGSAIPGTGFNPTGMMDQAAQDAIDRGRTKALIAQEEGDVLNRMSAIIANPNEENLVGEDDETSNYLSSFFGKIGDLGKQALNSQFIQGANPELVSNPNELQSPGLASSAPYNFVNTNRNADIGRAVAPADKYNLQSPEEWASAGYISPAQAAAEYGGQITPPGDNQLVGRSITSGPDAAAFLASENQSAIEGQNPQGMGPHSIAPPSRYDDESLTPQSSWAGNVPLTFTPDLESDVVPDSMTTNLRPGLEHPNDAILSWATPGVTSQPQQQTISGVSDPNTERNLPMLTDDYSMAQRYRKGPSWLASPSKTGLGTPNRAAALAFINPLLGLAGAAPLSDADRYANLYGAQLTASQDWRDSDFVGNVNPLMGSNLENQYSAGAQATRSSDPAFGDWLGGLFSRADSNTANNVAMSDATMGGGPGDQSIADVLAGSYQDGDVWGGDGWGDSVAGWW